MKAGVSAECDILLHMWAGAVMKAANVSDISSFSGPPQVCFKSGYSDDEIEEPSRL